MVYNNDTESDRSENKCTEATKKKNQNYGIEIGMTGITRETAAKASAKLFVTTSGYLGTYYETWELERYIQIVETANGGNGHE